MSQRSSWSALAVIFVVLLDPVGSLARENPDDGGAAGIPAPVAKREAAPGKGGVTPDELKRRLFDSAAPRVEPPATLGQEKKLFPFVRALPGSGTRSRHGDGAGGGFADTLCGQCPVKELDCGGIGDGALAAGDCQLGDGTFIEIWRLEILEPRELRIQLTSDLFDTYLLVTNDQCEVIFENDDCGLDNFEESCVVAPVPAGTYYIVANSFSAGETGAYGLDVECREITACVDCLSDNIACNESLGGELFDDDCVGPDGELFDIYGFELVESSRIHASMTSDSFDTVLELVDGDCIPIAGNDDCAPNDISRSCLVLDLEPGQYHLRLTSFGAGEIGPYEVTLECFPDFDLCEDCVVGPVECGETIEGTFPASRCVELDGRNIDLYAFDLAESGPVAVNLRSEGFDTFLRLFDANCEEIAQNDDCEPQNLDLSCLEGVELEAGSYFVGVSSFAPGESGDFSLEVRCPDFTACRDCLAGTLSCGDAVSGVLGEGTCRLDDGRSHDLWRLDIFGFDPIDLSLSVSAAGFDPRLALLNSSCEPVCEGEDPDGCREFRQLSPGTYYIRVSGDDIEAAGAYDLRVDCALFDSCASCLSDPVACGAPVAGALQGGDCRLDDGTFFDAWPFSLDQAQTVTVNMSSPEFDTYLFLLDSDCFTIATNDDCEIVTTDSCITIDLVPGDYFVLANSYARSTGSYSLSIDCGDVMTCVACRVGSLTCGEPVTGALPTSECQLDDGSFVDRHELVLSQSGLVDIELTSTEFDTYLLLLDESCAPIASNNDCQPLDADVSCLSLDLEPGTYYVAVNSWAAGERGAYELVANCAAEPAPGGRRLPGDCNGDASLNVADGLCLLNELFVGQESPVTCGGKAYSELPLSDFDGMDGTTIADAVAVFNFLFGGGDPPFLGTACVPIEGCESGCEP